MMRIPSRGFGNQDHNFANVRPAANTRSGKPSSMPSMRMPSSMPSIGKPSSMPSMRMTSVGGNSFRIRTTARGIAIGTGVPAALALVALIAIATLFPMGIGVIVGVSLAAVTLLALGITAIVFAARDANTNKIFKARMQGLNG